MDCFGPFGFSAFQLFWRFIRKLFLFQPLLWTDFLKCLRSIFCLTEHFKPNLILWVNIFQGSGFTLEKAMAAHSSTLAWKIPWMEEPGTLQSMGSLRVKTQLSGFTSLFTSMHWRRKWQPTPVFLPGESQGRGSLVGCRLWGCRVKHDWSDLAPAATLSDVVQSWRCRKNELSSIANNSPNSKYRAPPVIPHALGRWGWNVYQSKMHSESCFYESVPKRTCEGREEDCFLGTNREEESQ